MAAAAEVVANPCAVQYGRHSFDRFGDDMCELVLSYLSLEDKLRLQCVAKQWRRVVFNSQRVLIIDQYVDVYNRFDNLRQLIHNTVFSYRFGHYGLVDCSRLRSVLTACQNIRRIEFFKVRTEDPVLDVLAECCPRLESIALSVSQPSVAAIKRFVRRVGRRLKSVQFREQYHRSKQQLFVKFCPNVDTLESVDIRMVTNASAQTLITPYVRLKRLNINCVNITADLFDQINNLAPNLKSLDLSPGSHKPSITLSSVPVTLPNVEELFIGRFHLEVSFFANICQLLPSLKRLTLQTLTRYQRQSDPLLAKLTSLTELSILNTYYEDKTLTDTGVCRLIDNCPRLTKLYFRFVPNLTSKTIEKLIESAKQRPEETIRFFCIGPQPKIDMNLLSDIPNNLLIIVNDDQGL